MKPNVVRQSVLSIQVCVPKDYTDEEVVDYAEWKNSCGTTGGWQIRRKGSKLLVGQPERRVCDDDPNNVHITLDT